MEGRKISSLPRKRQTSGVQAGHAVADPGFGEDVLRVGSHLVQLATQPSHVGVYSGRRNRSTRWSKVSARTAMNDGLQISR